MYALDETDDKDLFLIKLPSEVTEFAFFSLIFYCSIKIHFLFFSQKLIKYQKKFNDLTLDLSALKNGDRFRVVSNKQKKHFSLY